MSVTFEYKDKGLKEFLKTLKELNGMSLTIGFQGPDGRRRYDTGINVATVASYQEFGTEDIPARPFLRSAMDRYKTEIKKEFEVQLKRVLDGKATPVNALSDVGMFTVNKVREQIDRAKDWAKPLRPYTIRKKGHDTILRDTDLMYRMLSYAVRNKAGGIIRQGGTL